MWALRPESLEALDERLTELNPQLIVEAGSGESSAVLSKHGRTISLEHLKRYARESQARAPQAEVRLCRLKPFHTLAGNFSWYDTVLPQGIDFMLIDGPPLSIGRQAALFAVWHLLSPDWEVWLDDADRPHEQACLDLWAQYFRFEIRYVSKSLVRLNPLEQGRLVSSH